MIARILILLSFATQAHAGGLGDFVKDKVKHELERRFPQPPVPEVMDMPAKVPATYNLRWQMSARVGPLTIHDQYGDQEDAKFGLRLGGSWGSMKVFRIEIRKVLW